MHLALHSYWRSSCSWRVRIGLGIKGLPYDYRPVDLLHEEQYSTEHRARSPLSQVPVLEIEEGGETHLLTQSMAILEWLEERFPSPPLLPTSTLERARVRALAEHVNSGIQPLQNSAAQRWLRAREPGLEARWVAHWLTIGLAGLEQAVEHGAGRFCHGDAVTLADIFLVPQLYAARRFGVELAPCPTLLRIEAACRDLAPFRQAEPPAQPDAPPEKGGAPEVSRGS
ncbi:MAG TPA: maleylacetoacetate isomerase [Anaeromyxobacteraceae bacterium]|nr:maleylacetoacetate isomerase [Anaeromyxobacteraceae bacterium]